MKHIIEQLEQEGIFTLIMPSPFPQVEDIRAYLIKAGGEWFMIDTGVKTPQAREALLEGVKSAGAEPTDVKTIFLTHYHIDHAGNAFYIVERSGGKIYMNPGEVERITVENAEKYWLNSRYNFGNFFARIGMPAQVVQFLAFFDSRFDRFFDPIPSKYVSGINHETELRVGNATIKALHFPGHTPGMMNYLWVEKGILFSGDHIIKSITPNALLEVNENGETGKALIRYIDSLHKTLNLKVNAVLSAHGEPVTDLEEHIKKLLKFYEKRKSRVLASLKKMGSATIYQLTLEMFPMVRLYDLFLAISEVTGILELLEEEGQVVRRREGELEIWVPA